MLRCWIFFEQYSREPHLAVNRHWKLHLPAAEQSRLADRFAQNHTRGEHALSVMEQPLSKSPWLAAGRYTIADIALCAHTHMAANRGFDLAPHPNGQSKTAEATVVKQQFDSVWARGRSRSARGTESLQTLCWREMDSNPRSPISRLTQTRSNGDVQHPCAAVGHARLAHPTIRADDRPYPRR